ncbi:hypothetical protein UFOVP1290_223 [uncultured Caudovirales phage]|uniref:Uncharacterized protein n=1 Tax=uncultured Caudovirales phage TaxID=2100421 RepID=A0A6J5RH63_9CAUD|nr:hypothetical protein UFOVP1290_223 [uncultured Caudovirales phage]
MFNRNNRMKMDDLRYKVRWEPVASTPFDNSLSLADNLRKFKGITSNVVLYLTNAQMFQEELRGEIFSYENNLTLWDSKDGANINYESSIETFPKNKIFLITENGILSMELPREYYERIYYNHPVDPYPYFPKKECGHTTYAFCDCWRSTRIDGKPQLQRKPCYHLVNKECNCTIF